MKSSVILPGGWWRHIRNYLLDGSGNEFCCYLFCGVVRSRSQLKLLGRSSAFPDKQQDYHMSSGTSCQPTLSYLDNIVYEYPKDNDLIQNNLSIVDIHSHPFAKGENVAFSSMDDDWQRSSVEHFFLMRRFTGYHCFIVLGEKVFNGRIYHWDKKNGRPVYQPLHELVLLDYPYRRLKSAAVKGHRQLSQAKRIIYDRQIRAFGTEGQAILGELTAGIIGVGGIGSIAAEGLTRLGVHNFVLIDHDHAEESNLNRCLGMTRTDALTGLAKTAITTREILHITPTAHVESVNAEVETPLAKKALKKCDFLILGTDNILSRACINEFAIQYNLPLFSVGTVINVSPESGAIIDIYGEYFVMLPGEHTCCLNCSGLIDYRQVSFLLSAAEVQAEGKNRGYVQGEDITQPAVRPLNGAITEMMLSEVHDLFCSFKGKLTEGLGYDQKRNTLTRRSFLNPQLELTEDGFFLEATRHGNGQIQVQINGGRPRLLDLDCDPLSLTDAGFSDIARKHLLHFIEKIKQAIQNKDACPYCGGGGRMGLGDNEPLVTYPYSIKH